jgi:hypothetical protein
MFVALLKRAIMAFVAAKMKLVGCDASTHDNLKESRIYGCFPLTDLLIMVDISRVVNKNPEVSVLSNAA